MDEACCELRAQTSLSTAFGGWSDCVWTHTHVLKAVYKAGVQQGSTQNTHAPVSCVPGCIFMLSSDISNALVIYVVYLVDHRAKK